MHFLILSDGKKGHENQSLGLVEAILRRIKGSYEISSINDSLAGCQKEERAHAIISAGHGTHPFLLRLARRYRCPSVVIMKPSLPSFLFSHCLVPEHDFKLGKKIPKNTIPTKGALNRIPEDLPIKKNKGLIMLGGPSKHFEWQPEPIIAAIKALIKANPDLTWTIGDSRRTPPSLLSQISDLNLPTTLASHLESTGSWLIDELLESQVAWITPDSTSMLFEALTAGCRLGTLPLLPLKTRLAKAHQLLAEENWLTPFTNHELSTTLPPPPKTLHETGRCAELILERLV